LQAAEEKTRELHELGILKADGTGFLMLECGVSSSEEMEESGIQA